MWTKCLIIAGLNFVCYFGKYLDFDFNKKNVINCDQLLFSFHSTFCSGNSFKKMGQEAKLNKKG